jgi:hypothetical protein
MNALRLCVSARNKPNLPTPKNHQKIFYPVALKPSLRTKHEKPKTRQKTSFLNRNSPQAKTLQRPAYITTMLIFVPTHILIETALKIFLLFAP